MIYENKKWKYEIPFNNEVYKEIKRYSFNLDEESKKIIDKEIEFYRHNFSLQQVMEHYNNLSFDERESFKDAVLKRKESLLYCPIFLKQHFLMIIEKDYNEDKDFFNELLTYATSKKAENTPLKLYKILLGKYYGKVKKVVLKYSKRQCTYEPKPNISDAIAFTNKLHQNCLSDRLSQGIWGEVEDFPMHIYLDTSEGYGRLRSHFISGVNTDSYTINLEGNNIEYSYYRNIYPGKAHLYNSVFPYNNRNIDWGAHWLINGWSIFSSLHIKKSVHTKNVQIVMANVMKPLLTISNYSKALEQCYLYCLTKMSKSQALNTLLNITQKVGLYESYALGGIATELLIDYGFATSPMDLLRKYRKVNFGDFFAIFK